MATDIEPTTDEAGEDAPKKGGLLGSKKFKVLLLVIIVMTAEAAGMYFFFSGGSGGGTDAAELEDPADVETVEVDVGTFPVSNHNAPPGTHRQISFQLYAVVAENQATTFEQLAKKKLYGAVYDKVQTAVSKANLEELSDPGKVILKKRIREEINKVLGKSYVRDVHLIKFSIYTQ